MAYYLVTLESSLTIVVTQADIKHDYPNSLTVLLLRKEDSTPMKGYVICKGKDYAALGEVARDMNLKRLRVVLDRTKVTSTVEALNNDDVTPTDQMLPVPTVPPPLCHASSKASGLHVRTPISHDHQINSPKPSTSTAVTDSSIDASNNEPRNAPLARRRLSFTNIDDETKSPKPSTSTRDSDAYDSDDEDDDDSVADKDYQPDEKQLRTGNYESDDNEDDNDSVADKDYQPDEEQLRTCNYESDVYDQEAFEIYDQVKALRSRSGTDGDREQDQPIADSTKRRYYTKFDICIYCKKRVSKIPRHFQNLHSEEAEVKRFLLLHKRSAKRSNIITKLRLQGNFDHNLTHNQPEDEIMSARKLHNGRLMNRHNYTPCPKCQVFLTKQALRRHILKCNPEGTFPRDRSSRKRSQMLISDVHLDAQPILKEKILSVMNEGEVKDCVKYDWLIILYGNVLCQKYRDEHHYSMIRNKLRAMGKFLINLKAKDPTIDDLQSAMTPDKFDLISNCLNESGQFNEITQHYVKPTLPTSVATALKYIANLYIADCIKKSDWEGKSRVKNLLFLLNTNLTSTINKTSNESLLHLKRQKPVILPSTDDIRLLNGYVTENMKKYYDTVATGQFTYDDWLQLSNFTIISILIFNRRRPGELERTLLTDVMNCESADKTSLETLADLTPDALKAIHEYVRFTIRGKLARGVPVLLNVNMKKCVDLLIQYRTQAGIHPKNKYMFAERQPAGETKNKSYRYIRATDLMRPFSVACGANNPEALRATLLRKHVATKSVGLDLPNNTIGTLQNFLGHADKIHNHYYRQPVLLDDITKMSKVLEIAQGIEQPATTRSTILEVEPATTSRSSTTILEDELPTMRRLSTILEVEPATTSRSSPTFEEDEAGEEAHFTQEDERSSSSPVALTKHPRKRIRLLDNVSLGYVTRKTWTTPEKHSARECFKSYLDTNTLPKLKDCAVIVKTNECLRNRTPAQMVSWVKNQLNKQKSQKMSMKKGWSTPERTTIKKIFLQHIKGTGYPSTNEILTAIKENPELQNRTPRKIKSQIQHQRNVYRKSL